MASRLLTGQQVRDRFTASVLLLDLREGLSLCLHLPPAQLVFSRLQHLIGLIQLVVKLEPRALLRTRSEELLCGETERHRIGVDRLPGHGAP